MGVLVVGAGISGVACAQRLRAGGLDVEVLDRGRVCGGRMASRRWEGRVTDLGASYLTIDDPDFRAALGPLLDAGRLRPWTDTFATWAAGTWGRSTGPMRYAASGGLRSVVEELSRGLSIASHAAATTVGPGPTVNGRAYDAVVLAMPAPQAVRLLDPTMTAEADACAEQQWAPVLAVAARYESVPDAVGDGVFVNDHDVLSFVAHDGRRRGDGEPVLVAHTTEAYAARHLDDPARGTAAVVAALREVIAAEPSATYTHRWSFARPTVTAEGRFSLGDAMVGLCGDGFSGGAAPKVENAWRSGHLLAGELLDRLT